MNGMNRTVLGLLIAAMTLISFAAPSLALDIIETRDGEQIEGEIIREVEGNVWIVVSIAGIERERFIPSADIASIRRDATPDAPQADEPNDEADERAASPFVPKGAVISLEGTVGIQMTAEKLRDLIPILEKDLGTDGSGIVVFKINSGGGLLLEIQRLSDIIEYEYKPRFQVVAWIDSAISAAAMTAHAIENIYFMPHGNYGACTGWSGQLEAVSGLSFEEVLFQMEKISERGGYDHRIMKAMQGHYSDDHFAGSYPLSYTIEEDGDVEWYLDADSGEVLLNPVGEVLTLTADQAEACRFSKGTAANLRELTELLNYKEIEWIGKPYEGRVYPASRAEREMIEWRQRVSEDEQRFNEYFANYRIAVDAARGANEDDRGKLVGLARRHLSRIRSVIRNNQNFMLLNLGLITERDYRYWLEDQEEMLRRIARGD